MVLELIPIVFGRSDIPESMAFENGAADRRLPIDFVLYYIRTEDRRILVDAGCDTLPGFELRDFIGPVKALRDHGIQPEEITDLIITHAHHDHIDGVRYFENATVYIQQDEYKQGQKYIPASLPVRLFEQELTLCDGVRMIRIGGHSVGSSVVEVVWQGKCYVVCGDECYVERCLTETIPTGTSCCPAKSREFVERYGNSEYTPLLCHQYRVAPSCAAAFDMV